MSASTETVYMNVGDTRTLSFNAPPYIVGTQWTISDWDAVTFTTTPGATSTRATIKALSKRPASDRCIVHCVYYYRERDPSGKYIYQRTGYQDWEIIIEENGSGGGGSSDPLTVSMHYHDFSLTEGQAIALSAYASEDDYKGNYKWTSSNSDVLSITDMKGPTVWIKAKSQGSSYLRVTLDNGNYDEVKVSVYPRYELEFTLTSDGNGYAVSSKDEFAKGEIAIPSIYNDKPVTEIKENGFNRCEYITSVIIPSSVVKINIAAFFGCKNLKSVSLGDGVECIENNAFSFCSNLKTIRIPKSVSFLGSYLFLYCSQLETVSIENAAVDIPEQTFDSCKNLKNINLGNSITSIGRGAFSNCESLTDLILPESLTSIKGYAFEYCTSLKTLIIPKNVNSLSFPTGLGTCSSLMNIFVDPENILCCDVDGILYNKSMTSLYSYPGGRSGHFTVPSNVTTLYHGAFDGCSKLTSISIHNRVNSIESYAFYGCNQLSKIIDSNINPQTTGTDSFGIDIQSECVPRSATIYVPNGSIDAYKIASKWDRFSDFREMGKVDITFNVAKINLNIGESYHSEVETILDSDVVIKSTSWDTSNQNIVSIDSDGNITAQSEGKATIYYTVYTEIGAVYTNSFDVIVKPIPISEILLSHTTVDLTVGDEMEISAQVMPENANQEVVWFSSDEDVAYVDTTSSQARIIAVSEGTCEVYACPAGNPDSCRGTCTVTVTSDQPEYLFLVGTLNDWDINDDSFKLNKEKEGLYSGEFYFDNSVNHEFVIAYEKGNWSSAYHMASEYPIPDLDRYFKWHEVVEFGSITTRIEEIRTSDKYNFKLPSNWPGGKLKIIVFHLNTNTGTAGATVICDTSTLTATMTSDDGNDEACSFYNLQGIRISEPEHGTFIEVRNGSSRIINR